MLKNFAIKLAINQKQQQIITSNLRPTSVKKMQKGLNKKIKFIKKSVSGIWANFLLLSLSA